MEPNKIIITAQDVDDREPPSIAQPMCIPPSIPFWWRLLSTVLILCPPILFFVAIVALARVRRRDLPVRHAQALHYCFLLLASGIIWMLAAFALVIWAPSGLFGQVSDSTALSLYTLPPVPSTNALTGKDIAQQLSPLVVVVHQAEHSFFPSNGRARQACGAGAIMFAGRDGCLLLTSRHVVDALSRRNGLGQIVGVSLQDGQEAQATVVGIHRTLDLALLWVHRENVQRDYVQPLRGFKTVEVGEQVFVIGHPEGLEFSISGGLVAQTRGDDLIQISAPVSPGNSGGPVYDTQGRLLAIVQSLFDKRKSPNAENLNFAVRADAVLNVDAWTLAKEARLAIASLTAMGKDTRIEPNSPETKR